MIQTREDFLRRLKKEVQEGRALYNRETETYKMRERNNGMVLAKVKDNKIYLKVERRHLPSRLRWILEGRFIGFPVIKDH